MKLSCYDWSDRVPFVIKSKKDNDMFAHIGAVYADNDIELLWPIRSSVDYDKSQIGQLRHWSYRCVYAENEIELLWPIESGMVFDKNYTGQ